MASFGYPKHKQKNLEFAKQHFWTQSSFWVKIHFDPMARWRGLDKSMYAQYITYSFSTTIGSHVYDSWNITKQKKIEKIMQCSSMKSPPLWYGCGFFLKKILLCIHY